MKVKLLTVLCFVAVAASAQIKTSKAIVASMTMEEKARLVVGMGMNMPGITLPAEMNGGPVVGQTQTRVPGAAGTTAENARVGIKGMVVADGPAGLRIMPDRPNETKKYFATAFPISSLLACSWNTQLIDQVGKAMGNEVKEYGVDVILGPAINIHRNPLGGRNFEYMSEDPYLAGKMSAAIIRGIQSQGVGTSLKHFAMNNHETNRNTINVKASQRAIREIYLKGFEIAIKEGKPWTVMSSYNKLNGTYTSQSRELLTDVLRGDWKYKGFVMTDWFGGDNPVEQMKAGNDLIMPGTIKQYETIVKAVKEGKLDEKVLDTNVERILDIMKISPSYAGYKYSNNPNLVAHQAIVRNAATEGMVLLKNDNAALPVVKGKKIAAFGNFAYNLVSGGTGSGDVNEAYTISLIQGLENAGFGLNKNIQGAYEKYLKEEKDKQPKNRSPFMPPPVINELPVAQLDMNEALTADLAIITIGRISGEFIDRKVENDLNLTDAEKALIAAVSEKFHAQGKKVVVILNVGGPMETASWKSLVDGILLTWQPGQEAGNAIADILSGKANPSGKLATTFSVKYEDEPAAPGFPGKELEDQVGHTLGGMMRSKPAEIEYLEGIYVGYRGFDKKNIVPAYEFGYGLSYTTFQYSGLKLSSPTFGKNIVATVTVKNTGKVAGKEIAQLYLTSPVGNIEKPEKELKGFAKTKLLAPGESQTLTFTLEPRDLCSFDETQSAWVAEGGNYTVKIGASSRNILLQKDFTLPKTLVVEKVNNVLKMK